jgi:hypothetical protein
MGFTANLNQVHAIHHYADADWFFNKITPVKSPKWDKHERPLGRRSAWHYRLERGQDAAYYDVCLYHTKMIRYVKPDQHGYREVYIRGHDSQTSRQFISHNVRQAYGGHGARFNDTEGVLRYVPFSPRFRYTESSPFSAHLVFDPNGRLIVERSSHVPIHRRVVTPEQSAARAQLRAQLKTISMLAVLRMDTYRANAEWEETRAYRKTLAAKTINNLKHVVQKYGNDLNDPEFVQTILEDLGQKVFDNLYSHYLTKNDLIVGTRWSMGGQRLRDSASTLATNITPKQFTPALERAVMEVFDLKRQDGSEALPLFLPASDMPKKFFW